MTNGNVSANCPVALFVSSFASNKYKAWTQATQGATAESEQTASGIKFLQTMGWLGLMWKLESEEKFVESAAGKKLPSTTHKLVRDDGVQIESHGANRERVETFTYSDGRTKFQFYATRFELEGKRITSTYKVFPLFSWEQSFSQVVLDSKGRQHVQAIKSNISDALITWSTFRYKTLGIAVDAIEFVGFVDCMSGTT